ncbi:unnamed protein product [Chironomus riparius]|uniref:Uncharacterized protein n=1 Tax=Chironomus riparius TaxID=315576 RepID=A0A9N9RJR6_9DIPT|nr:unnamed protein product [Chironomus riparius]
MGTYTSEDEVLELNADFSDFTSDDEKVIEQKTETITDPVINEKIWLKFFRKGKVSLRDIRDDLLRILVKVYGVSINGIYLVDNSVVLVEIEVDSSSKNFLLFIYEERLGNKIVNRKSFNDTTKFCDGKFSMSINNVVLFLVVLSRTRLIYIPCKTCSLPFGLSNGEVINIETSSFFVDERFNVYECLLALQGELDIFSDCLIGIRMELDSVAEKSSRIRFSLKLGQLSNTVLMKLKKFFGMTHFSPTTLHLLPSINDASSESSSIQLPDFGPCLMNADLLYPRDSPSQDIGRSNINSVNFFHFRRNSKTIKRKKRHSLLYSQTASIN